MNDVIGLQFNGLDLADNPTVIRTDAFGRLLTGSVDLAGNPTTPRTDTQGRELVAVAQTPQAVDTITSAADAVVVPVPSDADTLFFCWGTHNGVNLTWEVSPDSTNGVDGSWFPALSQNNGAASGPQNTTGVLATNGLTQWVVNTAGAKWARARSTAWASGSLNVLAVPTSSSRQLNYTAPSTVSTNTSLLIQGTDNLDSTTNLGVSATFTGTSRDRGSTIGSRDTLLNVLVAHTAGVAPGSLQIQESTDNTTWRETQRIPIPSDGLYRNFQFALSLRYFRVLFVNGATAQTLMFLQTSTSRADHVVAAGLESLLFPLSVTALGSSATFTGPTLDLGANHDWSQIAAMVRADQVSAADGFRIETSFDGTNFYTVTDAKATLVASTYTVVVTKVLQRYYRVVLVNAATAQGALTLHASLQ